MDKYTNTDFPFIGRLWYFLSQEIPEPPCLGIYHTSLPTLPSPGSVTTRLEVSLKCFQFSNWGLRREACIHLWKLRPQENALHRATWGTALEPLPAGWGLALPVWYVPTEYFRQSLFVSFQWKMAAQCSMLKLSNSLLAILKTWFRASKLLFVPPWSLHDIYIGLQFPYGNFIFLFPRIHTLLIKPTLTNWYATARRYRSSQEFHSLRLCYCHYSSREIDKVLFQTTNPESIFYVISQEVIQQSRNDLPGTCTKIFSTKLGPSIWLM